MSEGERVIRERIVEARRVVAQAVHSEFGRTRYEADDLVGTAMVFLLSNARHYNPAQAQLSTWCWRATRMAVINLLHADNTDKRRTLDEAISIHAPVRGNKHIKRGELITIADTAIDLQQDTEGDAIRTADYERAMEAIRQLPDRRMVRILMERYATDGKPKRLSELASEMGVTKERVRQIEKMALEMVRERMGVKKP